MPRNCVSPKDTCSTRAGAFNGVQFRRYIQDRTVPQALAFSGDSYALTVGGIGAARKRGFSRLRTLSIVVLSAASSRPSS
ncbi:hypothetical protein XAB3213_4260002 [Xanthomonas citri pv. bilvae]|nr:hypothetical protein XAB3213_4260002 [Xanthomonas citri pv. bilvae]